MALSAGTRLGPYEIQTSVGAGGMGEVYRARDTRLDRTVALKVIAPSVAAAADLRERFEREARAVSQLNHPNICTLHDVGHADGVDYLVLEYLEGETLADRLKNGPLPRQQATAIAIQICDALDKAHRAGIVHRDLKPGNVFLVRGVSATAPPVAKLLDFGLAKMLPAASGTSVGLTSPPTVTTPLTAQGTILGTFQYMAPEQLEGVEADARTDIWAFGCVLYEMLTGTKAFGGRTHASLISSIMSAQPAAIAASQPDTPPVLDHVIRTCLAKDPGERFQTAHDLLLQLRWMADGGAQPPPHDAARRRRATGPLLLGAAAAALVVATAMGTWYLTRSERVQAPLTVRSIIELPRANPYASYAAPNLAISPDGAHIVYSGLDGEASSLFKRAIDRFEPPVRLTGGSGALMPFFSPDGAWIGFFAAGKLQKIPASGGAATTICDMPGPFGAVWQDAGTIVFADAQQGGLMRVSASGGRPEPATTLGAGEVAHRWPAVLPDGSLIFAVNFGANWSDAKIAVQPADGGPRKTIIQAGTAPKYVESGHVAFVRNGALFVAPFDPKRMEAGSDVRQAADAVAFVDSEGRASYAVSRTGALVYVPRTVESTKRQLVWVNRDGTSQPLGVEGRAFDHPRISPDGRFVALTVRETSPDIWVLDVARGSLSRITSDPGEEESAVWTPDGTRLTYAGSPSGKPRTTYWKPVDNSAGEEEIFVAKAHQHLSGWTPDGKTLVLEQIDSSFGIFAASLADGKVETYLQTRFSESAAQVSPDGKWIAYTSNESDRNEVYVQSFPAAGHKIKISTDGGGEARWARNGRELFYRNGDRLMVVPITYTPALQAGTPRVLFEGQFARMGWSQANYDVSPDGRRFLMIKGEEQTLPTQLHLVVNWFSELKR